MTSSESSNALYSEHHMPSSSQQSTGSSQSYQLPRTTVIEHSQKEQDLRTARRINNYSMKLQQQQQQQQQYYQQMNEKQEFLTAAGGPCSSSSSSFDPSVITPQHYPFDNSAYCANNTHPQPNYFQYYSTEQQQGFTEYQHHSQHHPQQGFYKIKSREQLQLCYPPQHNTSFSCYNTQNSSFHEVNNNRPYYQNNRIIQGTANTYHNHPHQPEDLTKETYFQSAYHIIPKEEVNTTSDPTAASSFSCIPIQYSPHEQQNNHILHTNPPPPIHSSILPNSPLSSPSSANNEQQQEQQQSRDKSQSTTTTLLNAESPMPHISPSVRSKKINKKDTIEKTDIDKEPEEPKDSQQASNACPSQKPSLLTEIPSKITVPLAETNPANKNTTINALLAPPLGTSPQLCPSPTSKQSSKHAQSQSQLKNANKFCMVSLLNYLTDTLPCSKSLHHLIKFIIRIKNSGKQHQKVDIFTLAHFRALFLTLTDWNITQLSAADISIHEIIFPEAISKSSENPWNKEQLEFINTVKSQLLNLSLSFFEDDTASICSLAHKISTKSWQNQATAQQYISWVARIVKGIKKMAAGGYIHRF